MSINEHRFIFVCGLHRSGTSVLFRSLRDHPQVSGFRNTGVPEDEGIYLQEVYPQPRGHMGRAGYFGFAKREHLTENSPYVTAENRRQLFDQWGKYWDLSRPFLLEKSPPHLLKMRFLQALFPNSSFIVVLRHPIAVAYALRQWYRHYRIYWIRLARVLAHWLHCHELFLLDRPYLNSVFLLHYEQFVLRPEQSLAQICAFLQLDKFQSHQQIQPDINNKYFSRWESDRKKLFWQWEAKRLIGSYDNRCRNFGYSLHDPNLLEPLNGNV